MREQINSSVRRSHDHTPILELSRAKYQRLSSQRHSRERSKLWFEAGFITSTLRTTSKSETGTDHCFTSKMWKQLVTYKLPYRAHELPLSRQIAAQDRCMPTHAQRHSFGRIVDLLTNRHHCADLPRETSWAFPVVNQNQEHYDGSPGASPTYPMDNRTNCSPSSGIPKSTASSRP